MDTRTKIVDTAARLFYEQGYNSTGINQVIAEAGIAKASLYAHFASKEDLLKDYLQTVSAKAMQDLQHVVKQQKSPREQILAIFDYLGRTSKKSKYNGCHFLNVLAEIPLNNEAILPLIQKQKNNIRQLFTEILKADNKAHLADELYILFEGALMASKVFKKAWTINTTKSIVEKLI